MRRAKYIAYASNEYDLRVSFSLHNSRTAAEKKYGDLSRHYKGSASSDLYLNIVSWDEFLQMEKDGLITVDWDNRILRIG